jgi:hypothetical protein
MELLLNTLKEALYVYGQDGELNQYTPIRLGYFGF